MWAYDKLSHEKVNVLPLNMLRPSAGYLKNMKCIKTFQFQLSQMGLKFIKTYAYTTLVLCRHVIESQNLSGKHTKHDLYHPLINKWYISVVIGTKSWKSRLPLPCPWPVAYHVHYRTRSSLDKPFIYLRITQTLMHCRLLIPVRLGKRLEMVDS